MNILLYERTDKTECALFEELVNGWELQSRSSVSDDHDYRNRDYCGTSIVHEGMSKQQIVAPALKL